MKACIDQAKQQHQGEENQTIKTQESVQYTPHASSSTGIIHNKHLCVWCMKEDDIKHGNPFKELTIHLQNQKWKALQTKHKMRHSCMKP